ncbi:thiamine diphosphokinase [Alkaliphilus oremlandii]|uniref:Thiamine diphosphokinase n=1 Tax=Alkaliphilus oremlandii (strain OhILAs) TaxID=350688 RepID=A8MH94_ALKOO|nr:thiamine diphosphokinase [Alkaliphilus oremlandii]ABW18981.1 thiamine pyrophosphokinase [Alkaliphilus oremlandii OhILAs]
MEIAIVSNGCIGNLEFLKEAVKKSDYIICADGAARYLMEINVYPDLLVGDLDSIDSLSLKWIQDGDIQLEKFPVNKDMTDTELAIEFAAERMPKKITVFGGTGSRTDHSLGNILLLYKIHQMGIEAHLRDEFNHLMITDDEINVSGRIGQTISVIPIGGSAEGVTLKGLEYPLYNYTIELGSSIGISNRFIEENATIAVKRGILLVIKTEE